MKHNYMYLMIICILFTGCKKDFLKEKPKSSIVNPTTLAEFQNLLDYSDYMNKTGALPQLSSDEYFITNQSTYNAIITQTAKNAYLWKEDIYNGEIQIADWNQLYRTVFYANSVLDGINKIDINDSNLIEWNNLKGSALFFRSYAFYDLARNFCAVYNEKSSDVDLGIPIKISANIDEIVKRATLKETFDRIITDLDESAYLLRDNFSTLNRNRPSKSAVYALLARIYLYMGKYNEAENAANSCLNLYNRLVNFNTINTSSATPFTYNSDETIFYSTQVIAYSTTTGYTTNNTAIGVIPELLQLYAPDDLRTSIFYAKNVLNNYNIKRGYVGGGNYAFTGLATDEIVLIKAECAARSNNPDAAISMLNLLLANRYKNGTYIPLISQSPAELLEMVLLERRKELVWRALRWSDLKRLNRDGANITIKRDLNGVETLLSPNSKRYVFPIPDDEITMSGIKQNIR